MPPSLDAALPSASPKPTPALDTNRSIGPTSRSTSSTSACDNPGNTADIGSYVRGRIRLEFGDDYLDAVARQAFTECTANTVTAAGNDGNIDCGGHSFLAAVVGRFRNCADLKGSNILYTQEVVQ
jgi:hypothetical protein